MTDTDQHPPPPGGYVFFSTSTYALGKELGFEAAAEEFKRQIADPSPDCLPVVRTLYRLQQMEQIALWHDCAATSIGKARSRAFHEALSSTCDVWLTCDDDVETDSATLGYLVAAARTAGYPCVVLAPCVTRGTNVVNVALEPPQIRRVRDLTHGGRTVSCIAGGFGLVAMNRRALETIARAYTPELEFIDHDGKTKLAVFLEMLAGTGANRLVHVPRSLEQRAWVGEDVAFCRRAVQCGCKLEALVSGLTSHDGVAIHLESVPALGEVEPTGLVAS